MNYSTEIFFHPGLGKTGSTYLQKQFFTKLKGIRYIRRTRMARVYDELNKQKWQRYLVSREHDSDITAIVDEFMTKFPQAKIILVLRRHDKWLASQYRRYVKNGWGMYFDEFLKAKNDIKKWNVTILNFYDLILAIKERSGSEPLVLFHEELKSHPYIFFDKIANFTGAYYRKDNISNRMVHKAWNDKQLKALRKITRSLYFKNREVYKTKNTNFQRLTRKTLSHIIMYFYWLVPLSREEKQRPLIEPHLLEEIREAYAGDWQKCKAYAQAYNDER